MEILLLRKANAIGNANFANQILDNMLMGL